ncbi:MAG: hypothetical protein RJA36_217 [Pseudomonadota bacterium]|jgi:ABC-2 type transport system ATP-binding protein
MSAAAPVDTASVITVNDFSKRYGKVQAVRGVSLAVSRGQIYGLIGADGAGKSSLMKAVAGVMSHEGGTVDVLGQRMDTEAHAERVKSRIGFMPQGLGLNLYPTLSIEENVDFFARLRLVPADVLRERKERLLAMTRLSAFRDRAARQLSGGMKQKLGLVCTLIHAPELIILDEPTTGVDPVSRRDFWTILAQLIQSEGLTALISTAYLDEASRFDRLALMHLGGVLAEGDPQELTDATPACIAQLQADEATLEALAQAFPQNDLTAQRIRAYVPASSEAAALELVRAALPPERQALAAQVAMGRPLLEDVFVARLLGLEGAAHAAMPRARRAAPEQEMAIAADALTRDFGEFRAVDAVSFNVRYGEIFGLLGANGAGKTTAIKMLTGILPPSAGVGKVAGADMSRARQAIKESIGYMSQAFSLYTDLTVQENLLLFAGVYGLTRQRARERARWAIELGELQGYENVSAASLPMGLRQRLALGCALIHDPRVLFLDEPTSGVDSVGRRRFWDTLRYLAREQGVAILLTTHYMAEADLCDRLALMYAGRVVADATPEAMKASLQAERGQLLEVASAEPLRAVDLLQAAGFADAMLHGRRIHVMSRQPQQDASRIAQALLAGGLPAPQVAPQALTMEDVFIHQVLTLEAAQAQATAGSGTA